MRERWPINPDLITLRVCADLGWRVTVHCPGCRHSTDLHLAKVVDHPSAARPIAHLLTTCALTCRTRCGGLAASAVDVSCMDVGMLHYVARFRADDANGVRSVKAEAPARD